MTVQIFTRGWLVAVLALVFGAATALAQVTPSMVDEDLSPGASLTVPKSVETPPLPPSLDLCLLVDMSGSYTNDLPNIRDLDDGIFDTVRAGVPNSWFCLASFVDYPFARWGIPEYDYAYQLDQDLTTDKATWTGAIDNLSVMFGDDTPESQYEALYQMATGAGRDVTPTGPSAGDVPAGQAPSWRGTGTTRVIAITTDAPFHEYGDTALVPDDCDPSLRPCEWPGPTATEAVDALTAADVRVIAIKAPGASTQMDNLANATGGAVVSTSSTSAEIGEAIVAGLGNLPITVTPVPVGCEPLDFLFSPGFDTVTSGETVAFSEAISVPADAPQGTTVHCTVEFRSADDAVLGEQIVWIDILDVTAPQAACLEGPNPAGKVPRAGQKSPGQNEDGFYRLFASDNVDADPQLYLVDNGSGTLFGPYASNTNIKYTQAPGAQPGAKPGPGMVDWQIKGTGDFMVYAVDASGNMSPMAACLVPPPPK